jgi:hypothetical protein
VPVSVRASVERLVGVRGDLAERQLTHSRSDHLNEEDAILVGTELAVDSETDVSYSLSAC